MKKILRNMVCLFFALLGFCFNALAESDAPAWIDNLPHDSGYTYYIGRSSEEASEATAFTNATINAREQAITQNFGLYTQIRSETYQANTTSISTQNAETISQQVRLEDFGQVDFFKSTKNDKFSVWVLFKYNKAAIAEEKSRLAILKNSNADNYQLMISGNQSDAKINGTLEVTSNPSGIPIRINGVDKIGDLELRTPVRLMGMFAKGKHTVEFDDSKYEHVQDEIVLYPGTTSKIHKEMIRAHGTIEIETNLEDASVFIGSKLIGKTPLSEPVTVLSGSPISIEINHSEAQTYRSQIVVSRNEKAYEKVNLTSKPSTLSINSDPKGATVEIDGEIQNVTTPTGQISISRGNHKIRVYKSNYKFFEEFVFVKGGENFVLSHVKLNQIKNGIIKGIHYIAGAEYKINNKIISQNSNELYLSPGEYQIQISKADHSTYGDKVNLQEGEVIDLSSVSLKEIPTNIKKLSNPTWSLGIGFLHSGSPANNKSYSTGTIGINGRFQLFTKLGIDIGGYMGEEKYGAAGISKEQPNKRKSSIFKIGLPLTVFSPNWSGNDFINVIPELVTIETSFINKGDSESSPKTEFPALSSKQKGKGLMLEYRIFSIPDKDSKGVAGISFKAGYHKYEDNNGAIGTNATSMGIDLVFGF